MVDPEASSRDFFGRGGILPQPIEPLQADNIIIHRKLAANYIPPEIKPIETNKAIINIKNLSKILARSNH